VAGSFRFTNELTRLVTQYFRFAVVDSSVLYILKPAVTVKDMAVARQGV